MPKGHYEALNRALGLFGVKIEEEEHHQFFNGLPTSKKLEELERQKRLHPGLGEFINRLKQQHTKDLIPAYCIPDYSKILLLKSLKKGGYKIACCSNSMRETLHLMLHSAHLFDFFDFIIGNDEIKNPKPHPEIYLTAFKHLHVKPQECIIVEDAPYGVAAAQASGAHVITVKGPSDVDLSLFKKYV